MKKNKLAGRFWVLLGTINVLAMFYPIKVYVEADNGSVHARFSAALLFIGVNFVLTMIDAIAIAVASA